MKKLLIVSYDLIRPGESKISLSIGSLVSALRQSPDYGTRFSIDLISINLLDEVTLERDLNALRETNFGSYDWIAISAYVWGERWLRDFLYYLRSEYRYKGIIVIGGYQVSYSNDQQLVKDYSEADTFIKGYGEAALLKLIRDTMNGNLPPRVLNATMEFSDLPSPYLNGIIELKQDQGMVRMEAKRGCPYNCTFCAHKDNLGKKIHFSGLEKVFEEIELMKARGVKKM